MTDLVELQTAVRQVPGVASAVIRWPDPEGPASLRVEFATGADRDRVTESVMRTMVEVTDVDLSSMRVEHEPEAPVREGRPVFTTLSLERIHDHLSVEVTLTTRERRHVGRVATVDPEDDPVTMVASAAVEAINDFAAGPAYRLGRVDLLGTRERADEQVTVQVHAADRVLLGAALVQRDVREAVVRATLDAVNRHVIHLPV